MKLIYQDDLIKVGLWGPSRNRATAGTMSTAIVGTGDNSRASRYAGCRRCPLELACYVADQDRYVRKRDIDRAEPSPVPSMGDLRLCEFGDPSKLPASLFYQLVESSRRVFGYTHFWGPGQHAHLKAYCRASCETESEAAKAVKIGWKAFLVVPSDSEEIKDQCQKQVDPRITCATCGWCGAMGGQINGPDVVRAQAHGPKKNRMDAVIKAKIEKEGGA